MLGVPFEKLESHWTEVDHLRLHARVALHRAPPHAPDLVFVHGVGVSSRYLVPVAVQLSHVARVYAVDLPGFGRSDKPLHVYTLSELADALGDWLDAVGLEQPILFGNSFGCQIIAELAIRRPGRFSRAIFQGPTIDPLGRTARQQLARWILASQLEPSNQAPLVFRDYLACGLRRVLRTFRYALEDRIETKLPQLDFPVLVIRGSRDPISPQRWVEDATALLPQGRLVVIPAKAHTLNFSAPLELARVIRPFLDHHDERASTTTGAHRDVTHGAPLHR